MKAATSTLHAALTGNFKHDPSAGCEAIAAAELIACSLGNPPPEPKRQRLVEWTQQHSEAFAPELLELARNAVKTIKSNSNLRDLWKQPDGTINSKWLASIADLESRLRY